MICSAFSTHQPKFIYTTYLLWLILQFLQAGMILENENVQISTSSNALCDTILVGGNWVRTLSRITIQLGGNNFDSLSWFSASKMTWWMQWCWC